MGLGPAHASSHRRRGTDLGVPPWQDDSGHRRHAARDALGDTAAAERLQRAALALARALPNIASRRLESQMRRLAFLVSDEPLRLSARADLVGEKSDETDLDRTLRDLITTCEKLQQPRMAAHCREEMAAATNGR